MENKNSGVVMVNNISSSLIKADRFCDRIPVLSSINNLVDLVQKALIVPSKTSDSAQASRYFSYLNQKSAGRCAILMIPVIGNLIIGLFDFAKEQKAKISDKPITNNLPPEFIQQVDDEYIALRNNPLALKNARYELQSDKQKVKEAVNQNGLALEFASNELKNDISVVTEAVKQNGDALKFASYSLQQDEEIVKHAVAQNGLSLRFAHPDLRSRFDIAEIAVKKDGMALEYVNTSKLGNKIFIVPYMAVQQNGLALVHAHQWKDNDQLVKAAVAQNPSALQFTSERLQKDPAILAIIAEKTK